MEKRPSLFKHYPALLIAAGSFIMALDAGRYANADYQQVLHDEQNATSVLPAEFRTDKNNYHDDLELTIVLGSLSVVSATYGAINYIRREREDSEE